MRTHETIQFISHLDLTGKAAPLIGILSKIQHVLFHGPRFASLLGPCLIDIDMTSRTRTGAAALWPSIPGTPFLMAVSITVAPSLASHVILRLIKCNISNLRHELSSLVYYWSGSLHIDNFCRDYKEGELYRSVTHVRIFAQPIHCHSFSSNEAISSIVLSTAPFRTRISLDRSPHAFSTASAAEATLQAPMPRADPFMLWAIWLASSEAETKRGIVSLI